MKRIVLPIAILIGCFLISGYLIRNPTTVEEAAIEIIPVSVRVAEVNLESVDLVVGSQGKVQAAQTASLSAPVAGPVEWISSSMEAGGYVEGGQALLRLEAADFETALERSRANLQQAQAEAEFADTELARMRELAEQRLASDSQLQDAQRRANVNKARLIDAQASYDQAQLDLDRTEIRAPFNAVIQSRDVELGQYVNRAQSVALLYGADEVEVRVPLAIRQLGFLNVPLGQRGEISEEHAPDVLLTGMYGGQKYNWPGKLVRIEASIDPSSNTVQTIIRVSQPSTDKEQDENGLRTIPLPIGLYVEADIQGRTVENIISLPRSVIRNNNQVLIVDAENKMYYREVEIFRLEEQQVLISSGILPGERICISPIQAVVDGMAVQPVVQAI
ncbi:MAG: efflux RND transporter periplasmic adaptor subunit [Pseudomonadota bacterium]|nr:efflux RND transporter periplasmic adaptor subunit [Pseudomonadota bacterium]MEC7998140.1 efflux RND transporter periplasmic adaptor subunit [Pseudomonadota bacterium]MEC8454432.1 efflux RND transporter periplasmic adaptor subunit [Pseudomonadota bacterium]MEC8700944.1 efflux RND transporter periplasmic adaptor subunit [Pseudomonadota bacterium]MEC8804569.1 efflux RND transporter periplasmic adaptor subunit [Pseudomonadota bacterium]